MTSADLMSGALAQASSGSSPAVGGPRRTRRRAIALIASFLFHAAIILLAFGTMKGAVISGGDGVPDGQVAAVEISLAGLAGGKTAQAANPSAEAVTALFRQIRAEQSDLTASDDKPRPQGDLQKLFEAVDQERAAKDAAKPGGSGHSQIDQGGTGSAAKAVHDAAAERKAAPSTLHHAGGAGQAISTGDLWGQIKPCWDQLPAVSTVPITLIITLDYKGHIATPPRIVRPGPATPDERRLISEARALAAVTACVPYHATAAMGGQRTFTVKFGAG